MSDAKAAMLADTIWLRAEFFRLVPTLTAGEIAVLLVKSSMPRNRKYFSILSSTVNGQSLLVFKDEVPTSLTTPSRAVPIESRSSVSRSCLFAAL